MIIDKIGFWTSQMWKTFLMECFIKVPFFDKYAGTNLFIFHSLGKLLLLHTGGSIF